MGADDKGVIALGETLGELHADAVGFLRRDLPRLKGLAHMVGNHVVRAPRPAGEGSVLPLGKKELGVGHPAVALEAGDEPAVISLLRVLHIVEDVGDGRPHRPALAGVQGHEARRRHGETSPLKRIGAWGHPPRSRDDFVIRIPGLEWRIANPASCPAATPLPLGGPSD